MKQKSLSFLPISETGRWLEAREWAAEFCASQRAEGFEPEAVVAEITGCYPNQAINWNEAQFVCVDALICRWSG